MPTNIRERALGPREQIVGLLATIRWEAQFKLAKCCMRASKSISDLGVFLAEPVLEPSKALNDVTATPGSPILPNPLPPPASPPAPLDASEPVAIVPVVGGNPAGASSS
jgi:hypothetical protein